MQGAEKAANIWGISLNMQQRDLYNKLHQRVRGAISTAEPSQKIRRGVKGRFKLNMQDPGITIEKEKYSLVYSPTGKIYRGGVFWYHKIDLGDLDAGSISCCSRSAKTKRELHHAVLIQDTYQGHFFISKDFLSLPLLETGLVTCFPSIFIIEEK